MSARDDYPYISHHSNTAGTNSDRQQCDEILNEIDRLRRWKAEAIEVLQHWDAVAERFDLSGHLGEFTADAVGKEIDRLRQRLEECDGFVG